MEFVINQDKEENNNSSTEVFTIYGKQEFQDSGGFLVSKKATKTMQMHMLRRLS